MKTGVELITEERQRQIEKEGWTAEHDQEHTQGELAMAACCYAAPEQLFVKRGENRADKAIIFKDAWPFEPSPQARGYFDWDKRKEFAKGNSAIDPSELTHEQRIDLLVKAGALIAAEIDRLNAI